MWDKYQLVGEFIFGKIFGFYLCFAIFHAVAQLGLLVYSTNSRPSIHSVETSKPLKPNEIK